MRHQSGPAGLRPRLHRPRLAQDGIDLAEQLLTGLDLRATTLTVRVATLVQGAGTDGADDQVEVLRTETRTAGITAAQAALELAAAFHHAIRGDDPAHATVLARLRDLARGGDYAYYTDIAHHMAHLTADTPSGVHWLDDEAIVRGRWRALVDARRRLLRT